MGITDIGAFVPLGAFNANPAFLRTLGPAVEERGFESVWVPEHVVLFDDYSSRYPYAPDGKFPGTADSGLLEPLTALADIDVLSAGRVEFGAGIGWLREEFDAVGMPFGHRGARARDHLAVMKSLWGDDTSAYDG